MKNKPSSVRNIEQNWNCNIQTSVPIEIRPRAGLPRSKALIGTSVPEAQWNSWSEKVLVELAKLSSMTAGKLAFAQELMLLEVKQRQQTAGASLQNVAEILQKDLKRINRDLAQNNLATNARDGTDDESEEDDENDHNDDYDRNYEDGDNEGKNEHDMEEVADDADHPQLEDDGNSQPPIPEGGLSYSHGIEIVDDYQAIKTEADDTDLDMKLTDESTDPIPRSQSVRSNGISKASGRAQATVKTKKLKEEFKDKSKIANLFAEAQRLKQEAARRKAEAYELEAKMLAAEAKDLD